MPVIVRRPHIGALGNACCQTPQCGARLINMLLIERETPHRPVRRLPSVPFKRPAAAQGDCPASSTRAERQPLQMCSVHAHNVSAPPLGEATAWRSSETPRLSSGRLHSTLHQCGATTQLMCSAPCNYASSPGRLQDRSRVTHPARGSHIYARCMIREPHIHACCLMCIAYFDAVDTGAWTVISHMNAPPWVRRQS
jgi:hypothetical protein